MVVNAHHLLPPEKEQRGGFLCWPGKMATAAWKMAYCERMAMLTAFENAQQQQHVQTPDIRKMANSLF
jgi:hypothetical protein